MTTITRARLARPAAALASALVVATCGGGAPSPTAPATPPAPPTPPRVDTTTATTVVPGRSYFGRNDYVEYVAGDVPIVISAPHGGSLTPSEIPDRTYGTLVTDANTRELARDIVTAFQQRFPGRTPHVVIMHLRRTKVDANRDIVEGAQGDPEGRQAWQEFQDYIAAARRRVVDRFGAGFYVDLHGHGHDVQRLELGYLTDAVDLYRTDAQLDAAASFETTSSIRTLSERSPLTFSGLLRGATSLGTLYEQAGFPAVPSAQQPNPGWVDAARTERQPYFDGGYNTATHACRTGGALCGVQIEANFRGVRDTPANRARFAEATVAVLDRYFRAHLGIAVDGSRP